MIYFIYWYPLNKENGTIKKSNIEVVQAAECEINFKFPSEIFSKKET